MLMEDLAMLRDGADRLPVDCFMVRAIFGEDKTRNLFSDVATSVEELHEMLADLQSDVDIVYRDIEVLNRDGETVDVPMLPVITPQRSAVA